MGSAGATLDEKKPVLEVAAVNQLGKLIPVQERCGARAPCSMLPVVDSQVLEAERPPLEVAVKRQYSNLNLVS